MHALVDARGPLALPTLVEQLAVSLADRLPRPLVRVLGVRGLLSAAWLLALPFRCGGAVVGLVSGMGPGPTEARR